MIRYRNSYESYLAPFIVTSSYHSIIYLRGVTHVLLSLGSNKGDSSENLKNAVSYLNSVNSTDVVRVSSVHKTAPWGKTDQPDFLNQSVLISTQLTVVQLMEHILAIEKKMGRIRVEKWGPRVIDIDIVLFGDEIVNTPDIVIPHPFMHERKFVLEPSVEIAADMIHPVWNKTVAQLLDECGQSTFTSSVR